jgi:hypothetical protein
MFSKRKDTGFPYGCANAVAADGRRGNNVYEVNLWLWSFAGGKPRLGGLSVWLRTVGVVRPTKPDSK